MLLGEAASADEKAATDFKESFRKIIEEGGYEDRQIFNADATGLDWKKMPKRTYVIQKENVASGFKINKEWITVMLCSNASGDKVTKPLVIHHSKSQRSFKNFNERKFTSYLEV